MISMRIEQRGSVWVVLPEKGDRVLGTHKKKEDAEAQLRAIEASKARNHERYGKCVSFDGTPGPDGRVRQHVWDLVCVPGHDEKDGQSTDFNLETLSQFVDNFVSRGDQIPIDWNHQSQYAKMNGMPAPALGFYGSLAVVWEGKIAKAGSAKGIKPESTEGLDLSRDGLWAYRCEVTDGSPDCPLGQQLLPGFKFLSPTFTPEGVERDGTEVGYSLAAVAATNTPWQSGTVLTMQHSEPGALRATSEKEKRMAKLQSVAKLLKMEGDADDAAVKHALLAKMDDEAKSAMEEEGYDYEGKASALEEMAKAYEDAHMEEGDGDELPPHDMMRKMAAKFRKLAKDTPAEEPAEEKAKASDMEDEEEKAKMEDDKEKDGDAKMATMEAALRATQAKLEKLEKAEADREKLAAADRERVFESLADQAVAGGYPKESRGALVRFARTDIDGARASIAHFLPKTGAPTHLFDRLTRQGGPIGGDTSSREMAGPLKPRKVKSMGMTFIEDDGHFAAEIKKTAESKDPIVMEKLNKHLPASQREVMFNRLLAAEKVVRAERPDLAEEGE